MLVLTSDETQASIVPSKNSLVTGQEAGEHIMDQYAGEEEIILNYSELNEFLHCCFDFCLILEDRNKRSLITCLLQNQVRVNF